jgi:predicted phosphodiesterase
MMKASKYIIEVADYAVKESIEAAIDKYALPRETVRRYIRAANSENGNTDDFQIDDSVFRKLQQRFTIKELENIANGRMINPEQSEYPALSFDGEEVCFGFCTDTHIGSKYFPKHYWELFLEECYKQDVQGILHTGDLIEGMSNRPDHIYGLTHIGYSAQMEYATELLSMTEIPIHIIDGNHDRYGIKSGGLMVVKEVASKLDHVNFLGHDQATIDVNGTVWMLHHGEDGSSYATSYRVQKIIESFTGGEKPNAVFMGHTHKQGYFFDRNVHAVTGGALSRQSAWMRSKRLANHDGFWIIRATIAENEIKRFSPTWYAFY